MNMAHIPTDEQIRDRAQFLFDARVDERTNQDWYDALTNIGTIDEIAAHQQIAFAAYYLFQERQHTRALDDWFDAKEELSGEVGVNG